MLCCSFTKKSCGNTRLGVGFPQHFSFSQTSTHISITRQKQGKHVFYFSQKTPRREKGKHFVNFDYQNINFRAIITSTALASSVPRVINTIFNQSARVFCKGRFSNKSALKVNQLHHPLLHSLFQITRIISISFKLCQTPAPTFTLKPLVIQIKNGTSPFWSSECETILILPHHFAWATAVTSGEKTITRSISLFIDEDLTSSTTTTTKTTLQLNTIWFEAIYQSCLWHICPGLNGTIVFQYFIFGRVMCFGDFLPMRRL